jgi:hypothetical protein
MVVLLTIVYFIGFGITLFFLRIFKHGILKRCSKNSESFWIEAVGYNPDITDSLHQS